MARSSRTPSKTAGTIYRVEWLISDLFDRHDNKPFTYVVHGSSFTIEPPLKFETISQVQRYIDKLVLRRECRKILGGRTPNVTPKESPYADMSDYRKHQDGTSTMRLRRWSDGSFSELDVIHELSHHASGGHGLKYREAYHQLIDLTLGPSVGYIMRVKLAELEAEENVSVSR